MIKDFNYICGKILGVSDALDVRGDDISKRAAEKLRECVSDLDLCAFSEWKDIKTAPKNGSAFLGYNDKCIEGYEFQVWRYFSTVNSKDYFTDMYDGNPCEENPTHWRPLPNPPHKLSNEK